MKLDRPFAATEASSGVTRTALTAAGERMTGFQHVLRQHYDERKKRVLSTSRPAGQLAVGRMSTILVLQRNSTEWQNLFPIQKIVKSLFTSSVGFSSSARAARQVEVGRDRSCTRKMDASFSRDIMLLLSMCVFMRLVKDSLGAFVQITIRKITPYAVPRLTFYYGKTNRKGSVRGIIGNCRLS